MSHDSRLLFAYSHEKLMRSIALYGENVIRLVRDMLS
jgi:hypothetical protein